MNPTHVVEIERKYDVEDAAPLPPLDDLPGVGRVEPAVEHQLEAMYFDTADLRLASRHITLRRRTGGDDAGWHLKLPSATDERHEFHEPLGQETDGVPEPLLRLVRVHTRESTLVPIARLTTRRVVCRLRGQNDVVLADFSDDHVQAQTLTPKQKTQYWREWEMELVDGSRDLLEAGQNMLAAAGIQPAGRPPFQAGTRPRRPPASPHRSAAAPS
ncbi:CYTH domain-containing protein [Arthrobacter sp. UYEF20]|uniref:CYTH domain-containing protein n=1 Tax=Arthrobacter sp. UYEF20 TaxID=1756363 RepID=UPI003395825E